MQRGHGVADRLLVEGFDGIDGLDLDLIDRVVASGGEGEDAARMVMVNNFLGPKRFGKMFSDLPPLRPPDQAMIDLGRAMREILPEDPALENTEIPAGFTYLGQFVDHDLTQDETRGFPVIDDPELIKQGRTPTLDLDSLYGEGPKRQPDLYDPNLRPSEARFRFGTTVPTPDANAALPNDLPRKRNRRAVIGDDRDDENLVVAQTHLAFLKFHNRVMDLLPRGEEDDGSATFTQAEETRKTTSFHNTRRAVRWHYQWLVLNDFLPRIIDPNVLDDVRANGRRFFRFDRAPFDGEPFMPLEFSGAAYRFGHSMVRQTYDYNRVFTEATLDQLFTFTGAGVAPIPSNWIIDWRRFHEVGRADKRNFTRKMDPRLIPQLHELPNVRPNQPRSLAVRNLLRGSRIGLPKAQDVAEAMEIDPLTRDQLGSGEAGAIVRRHDLHKNTPLWFYVLKEAQVQAEGRRLGEMGSRIVAETFWGLLEGDENSFVSRRPDWTPAEDGLPARSPGDFTMADVLRLVDEINPIGG